MVGGYTEDLKNHKTVKIGKWALAQRWVLARRWVLAWDNTIHTSNTNEYVYYICEDGYQHQEQTT